MKTYYGNYLGVVIAGGEKDPEGRGRCQIFIPHIMPALYEGWNNSGNDVSFDIVGDGLPTSLDSSIVNKLQKILPWAECAAPIVGSSPSTKDGSETNRNIGIAAVTSTISLPDYEESGKANILGAGTLAAAAAQAKAEANYCGRAAAVILRDALKIPPEQIVAAGGASSVDRIGRSGSGSPNGQNWDNVFKNLGFEAIQINSPAEAPANSFLTYDSDTRRNKTPRNSGGGLYGHVEFKGVNSENQSIYAFGRGGINRAGGSVEDNFRGIAWVPSKQTLENAVSLLGGGIDVNPSAQTGNVGINQTQPNKLGSEKLSYNTTGAQKFVATGTESKGGVRLNYEGTDLAFTRSGTAGQSRTSFNFKGGGYLDGNTDLFVVAPATDNTGKLIPEEGKKYPLGSKVIVTNPNTNKTVVGIVGDYGATSRGWGEVSAATARAVGIKEDISARGLGTVGGDAQNAKLEIAVLPEIVGNNGALTREDYNSFIKTNNASDALLLAQTTSSEIPAEAAIAENTQSVRVTTPHSRNDGPDTNYQAVGMFGYASEGTTVWVFFREGDPLYPVYFAASYGQREWQNMYSYSSPGIGAGAGTGALPGTEKMRLNSYGGGFESAQATGNESGLDPEFNFQVYGKNGSNLLFTKDHTEFNSTYNHNQRVSGDFHEITEANKETRVRGDKNTYVEQDVYITVGNWSEEAIAASDEIQQYINEAMEIKSNVT